MENASGISNFLTGGTLTRLAVCAGAAAAVVTVAVSLCEGKDWPLWVKYGPWLTENKVQAIAILTALFYGLWLALEPHDTAPDEPDGFSRCEF